MKQSNPPDRQTSAGTVTGDHGWWVRIDKKSLWVPDTATLRSWVGDGRLGRNDLVWDPETSQWIGSTSVRALRLQFYPFSATSSRWRYDAFLATWPFLMLIVGLAGIVLIAGTLSSGLLSAIRAVSWKETNGRITRSAMRAEIERFANGTELTRYRVDFRYEYHVDERRFESSRIAFSEGPLADELVEHADAERVVGRYPAGQRVTVYFDPNEPASAVLDRGIGIIVGFLIGIGITAIVTLVLVSYWRRRRKIAEAKADRISMNTLTCQFNDRTSVDHHIGAT